jgi:hypothetical protein
MVDRRRVDMPPVDWSKVPVARIDTLPLPALESSIEANGGWSRRRGDSSHPDREVRLLSAIAVAVRLVS